MSLLRLDSLKALLLSVLLLFLPLLDKTVKDVTLKRDLIVITVTILH